VYARPAPKPDDVFARAGEWEALSAFVTSEAPSALLGVVSGRRRQGKSFLLQALCERHGGFYFSAAELTGREALAALGAALGERLGVPPLLLDGWPAALDALLAPGARGPVPVVLDELPYLTQAVPELPSLLQAALAPRRATRLRSRTRLLVCGSALSVMGRLLSGTAPLRGRASLELLVQPFDYRTAARFWGVADDPALALRLHAVVGGTPAYRREFVDDDAPRSRRDFDAWVARTVLNVRSPLFREARYLLAEEADLRSVPAYHALLAAVTSGDTTRARIARALGRTGPEITHQLTVLEDAGLLVRHEDALRLQRPTYGVAEPLLAFYEAVMRPQWAQLERGRAAAVWGASKQRFEAQVLGPHLESIAREWAASYADEETLGGLPSRVEAAVVNDPAARTTHQVDLVALGIGPDGAERVLALGEVKLGVRLGEPHLERLRRVRDLIGPRAKDARLLLIGGGGFDASVRGVRQAQLIELDRLY